MVQGFLALQNVKGQSLCLARAQDLFRANMKRELFSLGDKRLKRFFTTKQLADVRVKFKRIEGRTDRIVVKYVSYPFKNEQAREYALHGFGRRVGTLRRCIENAFKTVPPSTVKVPAKSKLYDAQINVQGFIANAYGSVDNLAWIWVHEQGLTKKIRRTQIGLRKRHNEVRASLSAEFQKYLEGLDGWFDYITEYRDALAHRIPLYIPPGGVRPRDAEAYNDLMQRMNNALSSFNGYEYERLSAEQSKLLVFQPLITHSVRETTAHFAFHAQLIADFLTIEELGQKMLMELKRTA